MFIMWRGQVVNLSLQKWRQVVLNGVDGQPVSVVVANE